MQLGDTNGGEHPPPTANTSTQQGTTNKGKWAPTTICCQCRMWTHNEATQAGVNTHHHFPPTANVAHHRHPHTVFMNHPHTPPTTNPPTKKPHPWPTNIRCKQQQLPTTTHPQQQPTNTTHPCQWQTQPTTPHPQQQWPTTTPHPWWGRLATPLPLQTAKFSLFFLSYCCY